MGIETLSGTERRIAEDLTRRQQFGIKKYGQTVAENPLGLKQWTAHAKFEALDQTVYLQRKLEQIEKIVGVLEDALSASAQHRSQRLHRLQKARLSEALRLLDSGEKIG